MVSSCLHFNKRLLDPKLNLFSGTLSVCSLHLFTSERNADLHLLLCRQRKEGRWVPSLAWHCSTWASTWTRQVWKLGVYEWVRTCVCVYCVLFLTTIISSGNSTVASAYWKHMWDRPSFQSQTFSANMNEMTTWIDFSTISRFRKDIFIALWFLFLRLHFNPYFNVFLSLMHGIRRSGALLKHCQIQCRRSPEPFLAGREFIGQQCNRKLRIKAFSTTVGADGVAS